MRYISIENESHTPLDCPQDIHDICPNEQNRLLSWYFIDMQAVKGYFLS
jgi:hypothetical protein